MVVLLKMVTFILLMKGSGFVSCGFTYDDQYGDVDKDNYGFDLSEVRHIGAEQPKYNTMIRGYRGAGMPHVEDVLAKTGDPCDVKKYKLHLEPIHKMKSSGSADLNDIIALQQKFANDGQSGVFTWVEVCYHTVNSLYCKNGICDCLEVPENGYFGLKQGKEVTYDPVSFSHYKFCEIQENYGCDPQKEVPRCDRSHDLVCSKIGVCIKSSTTSLESANVSRLILLILIYKFLCL